MSRESRAVAMGAGEAVLRYLVSAALALGAGMTVIGASGGDPLSGIISIAVIPFSSPDVFALLLQKFSTVLMMSLAFSLALKAYRFNVGIEGQFLLGASGAAVAGILANAPPPLEPLLALLAGLALGSLWAAIPAYLMHKLGVSEIVSTLLMNFISFYLVDLIATGDLRDAAAGHPMTVPIRPDAALPLVVGSPRISVSPLIALASAAAVGLFLYRTVAGYELRASGSNKKAAAVYGINTRFWETSSIVLGGALAGLAGAMEVSGFQMRLISGMQGDYMLVSVLSALLARGEPAWLVLTSMGISVIDVGSSALQRISGVPSELGLVIEGIFLLTILAFEIPRALRRRLAAGEVVGRW